MLVCEYVLVCVRVCLCERMVCVSIHVLCVTVGCVCFECKYGVCQCECECQCV